MDPRESVSMFEHQLVVQQLRAALEENYKIKDQLIKVQTDIGSVASMIDDRLFQKYEIDKSEFELPNDYILRFADTVKKVDKSLYMNRSELPQIDTLAKTLFGLFEKLSDYFNNRLGSFSESIDFSEEGQDKVGYVFSQNKLDFGLDEADWGKAIPEEFKEAQLAKQLVALREKMGTKWGGSSMHMTSALSNSKVRKASMLYL